MLAIVSCVQDALLEAQDPTEEQARLPPALDWVCVCECVFLCFLCVKGEELCVAAGKDHDAGGKKLEVLQRGFAVLLV